MTKKPNPKIVFLTSGLPLYWILANALIKQFDSITVIQETPEPRKMFLSRRRRLVGDFSMLGQLAFGLFSKMLDPLVRRRQQAIVDKAGANMGQPNCEIVHVTSVNSEECRDTLKRISPDVIMVVGTRIIGKKTIECVDAPFVNYHPGKTPKYRGMLGAYWTLVNRDLDNLALTFHLVDENVDTGGILYQNPVVMPAGNNIKTYSYVMAVEARALAGQVVEDVVNDELRPYWLDMPSKQWFHPTLWGYIWNGITRRVW